MDYKKLNSTLGKIDIYLLDQVMKSRYSHEDVILDAGCGNGRNLIALNKLGLNIKGCDRDEKIITTLRSRYPDIKLDIAELSTLHYESGHFDHVICIAVLHFASSDDHFMRMIDELERVMKPKGTLFVRMTSLFTLPSFEVLSSGQYRLPDGTKRFLLNDGHLEILKTKFRFIEPIKTVNVDNIRCMSTLVLQKL